MDMAKIKAKLEQFQQSSMQKSSFIWKPPTGKTQIRMVEYKLNKDIPFVELYFHFNIDKKKPILSPISYGEPDPIVEFANKLAKSGDNESILLAKKLRPKLRVFAPIIVRAKDGEPEADGVKIWGFGKTVANEIMSFMIDPDYGNIADPLTGRDIVVESITKEEAGNGFGKTNIRVKPSVTPLSKDTALVQKYLETQPDINALYQRYTYDELKGILQEYLNPSDGTTDQSSNTPSAEALKSPSASVVVENGKAAIASGDTAFDDIFNKK